MSQKHYRALAAMVESYATNGGSVGVEKLAYDLSMIMRADNPRFDLVKFYAACGVLEGGSK